MDVNGCKWAQMSEIFIAPAKGHSCQIGSVCLVSIRIEIAAIENRCDRGACDNSMKFSAFSGIIDSRTIKNSMIILHTLFIGDRYFECHNRTTGTQTCKAMWPVPTQMPKRSIHKNRRDCDVNSISDA